MNKEFLNHPDVISYENNNNLDVISIAKAYTIRDTIGYNKKINNIIEESSKKLGYHNDCINDSIKNDLIYEFKNNINNYFENNNNEHSFNYDFKTLKENKLNTPKYLHKIQRFNNFYNFYNSADENVIYNFYSSLTLDELNTLGW